MSAGIGMGANIVGGELQGWAALLDKWAMQEAYKAEANRQAGFRDEALGTFNKGVGQSNFASAQKAIGAGSDQRRAEYGKLANVPLGSGFSPQSGYNPTADNAYMSMIGNARANLGGYSDWAFNQSINNLRNQQNLSRITNFAGGQARNVFPLQMYAAQHSNDDLAAIGQAISSLGGAAANYAQFNSSPTQGQAQVPTYYPMGPSAGYPGYTAFQGYTDAYGNTIPQGWNLIGGGQVPG
jgi:hypothetical protein